MRMDMGSPRGATCSTITNSPGMQPISINFNSSSELSKPFIFPRSPVFSCDNLVIAFKSTSNPSKGWKFAHE